MITINRMGFHFKVQTKKVCRNFTYAFSLSKERGVLQRASQAVTLFQPLLIHRLANLHLVGGTGSET